MLVTLISSDIVWENEGANLRELDSLISQFSFTPELIILPEMFSTGFTMNPSMALPMESSPSLKWMQQRAKELNCAIVGSIPVLCREDNLSGRVVNRAFFVLPDSSFKFYDKRHLFRMGEENSYYTPGDKRCVVEYKGVRFALNVCYDLRFPVWSRNVDNEYDVLIYVANFPAPRVKVIEPLCRARAIENLAYMLFVNRVGEDPQCKYLPSSYAFDFKGDNIGNEVNGVSDGDVKVTNALLDIGQLRAFRERFPAWMDADRFEII